MVEVIGAGWGRTGTTSLKVALDILGLPCHHMIEVVKRPHEAEMWLKAAQGPPGAVDIDDLLRGWKACVDWPSVSIYQQLMQHYPDAKVILTVRDPAKWWKSARDTIWRARQLTHEAPWYVQPVLGLMGPGPGFKAMINALVWQGSLQGTDMDADPARAQQLFLQHIESVKAAVPPERLLVFEPSMGWAPLCEFLGRPVPDQPFPRVNESAQFVAMVDSFRRTTNALTYGIPALAAAVAAVGLAVCLRRAAAR